MQRLASLQVLRGLAALAVVLYHAQLFSCGWLGVDLFFCLSGFLITRSHYRDIGIAGRVESYAVKRFVRIYPLMIVILGAWCLLHLAKGIAGYGWASDTQEGKPFWAGLLPTVFMTPTIFASMRSYAITWTLAYEAIFYVAFALAIRGGRKLALVLFWGWLAMIVGFNLSGPAPTSEWESVFNTYILEFMIGALAAVVPTKVPIVIFTLSIALLAFGGISHIYMHAPPSPGMPLPFGQGFLASKAFTGTTFSLLILGTVGLESRFALTMPKALTHLGNASYSLYLFHPFMLEAVSSVQKHLALTKAVGCVASSVAALVGGLLIFRFVETPLLSSIKRRLPRTFPAKKAPTPVHFQYRLMIRNPAVPPPASPAVRTP